MKEWEIALYRDIILFKKDAYTCFPINIRKVLLIFLTTDFCLQVYFMKFFQQQFTENLLLSISRDTQMSKTVSALRKLTM